MPAEKFQPAETQAAQPAPIKPEKRRAEVIDFEEAKKRMKAKKEMGGKISQMKTQVPPQQAEAIQEALEEEKLGKAKTEVSKQSPVVTGLEKTRADRPEKIAKTETSKETAAEKTEITTEAHFKKVLVEITYDLFEKSLKHGMVATSTGHLERAFKMNLPEYHKMKTELLDHLVALMEKENLALEYKVELQVLKSNIESDYFDFMADTNKLVEAQGLSEKDQNKFKEIMKTSEIQSIPNLFERRIAEEDIVGSYRILAKAHEYKNQLEKGQYEEMKALFILTCDAQLAMPDDKLDKLARKKLKKAITEIENDIYN